MPAGRLVRTVGVVGLGAMGSRIARRLLDGVVWNRSRDKAEPFAQLGATAAGLDLRLLAAAKTWLDNAAAAGLDDRDYTAVLTQIAAKHAGPRE